MIRESFEELFEREKETTVDYLQTISLIILAICSIIVGLFV
jgi:hypothetical protein|tara:strand:+ start:2193 stop:2315 length:123 start_codon:yes stop_codon:yes gene_type:complete